MPDWFYRTLAQPALFLLPDKVARALALGLMGGLGECRPGRALIDFMGHMHADPRLRVKVGGVDFPSPVGLGWRVDPEARATRALQRFGVGFIEQYEPGVRSVRRGEGRQLCDGPLVPGARPALGFQGNGPRLLRRELDGGVEALVLPTGVALPVVPWDTAVVNLAGFAHGVVLQVGERLSAGGWRVPTQMPSGLPAAVRNWRDRSGVEAVLIVAGGVAGPADAVALIEAGASLVLIDAGLVFSGPGLVKRCNAALLGRLPMSQVAIAGEPAPLSVVRTAWFWALALGLALAAGGGLALGLAFTRVLLPYDEQFLGLTADVLRRNSPQLHAFMAHDRGTLAGTMLGLGWLYAVLAWRGIRFAVDGAQAAVASSALTGFLSFFSFLGFGYFDTLHAFVAAVLFQLTVQILVGAPAVGVTLPAGADDEDGSWRRAQWGQLSWVIHAVGLIGAGVVILAIGMTQVFVTEDLAFLCMDAAQAQALGEKMVSVVAHDRATLGGMLLAAGTGMLLPVLWCWQRGASWLWWAVAGLGLPAYGATLGMHVWVGYTDPRHILPALAGLALWLAGLWLSGGYLRDRGPASVARGWPAN